MTILRMLTLAAALTCGGAFNYALASEDRVIPIEGVANTRDLGGLKTDDGRSVRIGQLIRSGEIDGMGADGMTLLEDLGVTSIVDLRTTLEATAHPILWPDGQGPARYNFPVMEKEAQMIDDMRHDIKSGTATEAVTDALFFDAFGYIPTDYTTELRGLFDVLINQPEGEAVLYHCSGGKDRTGVATAMVLSALGVTREDIEADFMMSNVLKDADNASVKIADQVNAEHGTSMPPEAVWPSLGVRIEYLDNFYRSVNETYGSVDNYLHEGLGLTDEDLEKLRNRYLN